MIGGYQEETGVLEAALEIPLEDLELAGECVLEMQEHLEIADESLLILEAEPDDEQAIGAVFRAFHTIKGCVGFLGLTPIVKLAHEAESILDSVRSGQRRFDGAVPDVTFRVLDTLKTMMEELDSAVRSASPFRTDVDVETIVNELRFVMDAEFLFPDDSAGTKTGTKKETVLRASSSRQALRVDPEKIDLLLDTIGELVIAESIVAEDHMRSDRHSIRREKNITQLSKITRSLQDIGMAIRMIPVDGTFKRMARLVRDLSKTSGKEIEFSSEGNDTELDKAMVEKLVDPLVHMIRNAIDHGIGTAGKITLRAFHRGGNIHIEVADDGKGLSREKIAARALQLGLLKRTDDLSDEDVFSFIFEPGFSTAEVVTELSGRGVGMDVVKKNVEALRGSIKIHSVAAHGTTFTIILPLTAAIIDGMIVRIGEETYIIPVLSIVESLRPSPDMLSTITGRGEVLSFRGDLVPLFRLATLFDIDGATDEPENGIIVVLEDAGKQAGLLVDELLGQQQTVIKALGKGAGNISGIAGACILADGRPGLIIDPVGVIRMATVNETEEE